MDQADNPVSSLQHVAALPGRRARPLRICTVSTESRRAIGGLATYQRCLVRSLKGRAEVSTVALYDRELAGPLDYGRPNAPIADVGLAVDGVPTRLINPVWMPAAVMRRLRHFTSRPRLRWLASRFYAAVYERPVSLAIPDDVDVVHYIGTGWDLLGFAAMASARRRGAAFTVWPAVHPETWGDSRLDIDLYDRADAVFCQSDHELEHLAERGVARQRLVRAFLAPAVDASGDNLRFRARHQLDDRPLILFIAKKVRSKGFHVLCEAMPAVLSALPGACLVAIGPDGEQPYPAVAAHAFLDLGMASEADKADALAACDVFCMPSAAESFGIVYAEAWNYGKAVIGGPAPAVLELLRGGEAGIPVEQDARAVADAVVRVLSNEALRSRLGRAGIRLIHDQYNWNVVRDLHLKIFTTSAERAGAGHHP